MPTPSAFNTTIGQISPPPGVSNQIQAALNSGSIQQGDIAVLYFASNILKIVNVIAGLWVVVNIVLGAISFISSGGDSKAITQMKDKLTMSVIGLIIIISAYTFTAIVSWLLVGSPTYFLNPIISGPQP